MPPRPKVTKEMIVDAAFNIVREEGAESLNARTIAARLGCSTQPVLYCFKTIEEIRNEVYSKTDEFHGEYLFKDMATAPDAMKSIGNNYIRFAYEEKHLFRFLFQSNKLSGQIRSLTDDEQLMPIYSAIMQKSGIDLPKAKKMFAAVFYPVHGLASLLANNAMEYNEEQNREVLDVIYLGVEKEMR